MKNSQIPSLVEPQYVTTIIAKIKAPSLTYFDSKNTDLVSRNILCSTFSKQSEIDGGKIYVWIQTRFHLDQIRLYNLVTSNYRLIFT